MYKRERKVMNNWEPCSALPQLKIGNLMAKVKIIIAILVFVTMGTQSFAQEGDAEATQEVTPENESAPVEAVSEENESAPAETVPETSAGENVTLADSAEATAAVA